MHLMSNAFAHGEEIPRQHTLDGANVSPRLAWQEVPPGTQSLALVVDDPDAPDPEAPRSQPWVHWVLVDLPPTVSALPEGVTRLPGGKVGLNDWHHTSWDGPSPPVGKHRYRFKLYALDRVLGLDHPNKAQLEAAMQDHILAEAQLIGTYQKPRPR